MKTSCLQNPTPNTLLGGEKGLRNAIGSPDPPGSSPFCTQLTGEHLSLGRVASVHGHLHKSLQGNAARRCQERACHPQGHQPAPGGGRPSPRSQVSRGSLCSRAAVWGTGLLPRGWGGRETSLHPSSGRGWPWPEARAGGLQGQREGGERCHWGFQEDMRCRSRVREEDQPTCLLAHPFQHVTLHTPRSSKVPLSLPSSSPYAVWDEPMPPTLQISSLEARPRSTRVGVPDEARTEGLPG